MNNDKKNRREFLKTTGKAGLAAGFSLTVLPSLAKQYSTHHDFRITGEEIPYEQRPLPYTYSALESAIDAMTMEIHYSKHAATYAKNLSDAVKAEGVDTNKEKLTS